MTVARTIARDISDGGIAEAATGWTRQEVRPVAALDWRLVTSFSAFAQLEADWSLLHQRTSRPAGKVFLSFNWNWHWCRHYLTERGTRLAVVVGSHKGAVVSIWPMVTQQLAGLRVATFMGMPVSQYGDVLIDRADPRAEAWLQQGWNHVRNKTGADLVHLCKVRDDSAAGAWMQALGVPRDNVQAAPYVDLAGETSFEGFDQRFSGKDRKNRRRKRRRMEEAGAVDCRRVDGAADCGAAVALAMQRKRDWLASEGLVSAAVTDPRFEAFIRDAASCVVRPTGCGIVELTVDGHPVATEITVSDATYRGLYVTSYDPAAEKFSPGTLALETMFADAIAKRITTFDFMAPAAPYKLEWTDKSVGVADYAVSSGLMGWLYLTVYLRGARPRLQRLAKHGPAPLRRAIARVWRLLCRRTKAPAGPND